jgi:recombination protein RecA
MLLINQVRINLGITFGDNITTSGGKAVGFHSSVRVFLKSMGKHEGEINGLKTPIGMKTRAIIKKNRLGPPLRTADYDIYFDRGIDDYTSCFNFLYASGKITKDGISYVYSRIDKNGEIKYQSPKFKLKDLHDFLNANPTVFEMMVDDIAELFIMEYNSTGGMETTFNEGDSDE